MSYTSDHYLPAMLVWLLTPLDWGTRIVFSGHFIFALMAGWKLGSVFILGEIEKVFLAIILVSPTLPALHAGHIEKVMAWGWVLISIYFQLNDKISSTKRGFGAGICWGVIALTGANYQVLYQGVILIPLVFCMRDKSLFISFLILKLGENAILIVAMGISGSNGGTDVLEKPTAKRLPALAA